MASPAESNNVHKKKKKNLFASLFQKNKTKSKHKDKDKDKEKDKTFAHARAPNVLENVTDNVAAIAVDRGSDVTATSTVPESNIQYVHSVKRLPASKPPAVEQLPTIPSHHLDSSTVTSIERHEESVVQHQQELAVLNDSCVEVPTCVARSRSSSHSSGFDEVSSSMTECSCSVEQTKPLAIALSLTPVVDALQSNDDNNNFSSQSPAVVTDDAVCDESETKDEEPVNEELQSQDCLNDVREPQVNDDVQVECLSNDITASTLENTSTTESTGASSSRVTIGSDDTTAAALVKLRELSVRIARPSSVTSMTPNTGRTVSPVNRTRTYALNTAYRNMIASGTPRSPTSVSEQSPLRQLATKWRQPSLPKTTANATTIPTPVALTSAGGRTPTSAPSRSLRRSRSSSPGDNAPRPELRSLHSVNDAISCTSSSDVTRSPTDVTFRPTLSTQRSMNDAISLTSSSIKSHRDDIDDVASCHSNTDADSSVFVHVTTQQRRYSSAVELSQPARDVVVSARVKKALQRRLDVWNLPAKTASCQGSSELGLDAIQCNQSESEISLSVDEINRLSTVSAGNQAYRINRQTINKPSMRRVRPTVSSDTDNQSESGISFSVDEINRLSTVSAENQAYRINRQTINKPSMRRVRPTVGSDPVNRNISLHRSMSDQCAELTQSLARWGKQFADKSCPVSSSPTWQQMNSSEQEQLEVIQEMSTPPWSPPGITHASSVPRRTSPTGCDARGTNPMNIRQSDVTFKECGVPNFTGISDTFIDGYDVIAQAIFSSTNDLTTAAADAANSSKVKGHRPLQRSYSSPTKNVQATELPRTAMARLNDDGTPRSILKKTSDKLHI